MTITLKYALSLTVMFLLSCLNSQLSYAEKIYKWIDSEGNVHYSDRADGKNQVEQIRIAPGPSEQNKEEALKREQQLKSTADSLQQDNQQRAQQRTEEQNKRAAALAEEEKASQKEAAQGQNNNNYGYYGYPGRPHPPGRPNPPNYPRPPGAIPLPSGAQPGHRR